MQALLSPHNGLADQYIKNNRSKLFPSLSAIRLNRTDRGEALMGRLEELLVFEIMKEGQTQYKSFTVRSLYKYALKAIKSFSHENDMQDSPRQTRKSTIDRNDLMMDQLALGNAIVNLPNLSPDSAEKAQDFTTPERGPSITSIKEPALNPPEDPKGPSKEDKRLGSFLHPRDMRKLVTSFSASNEPELIVRRHAMLLNFDPLRAIILRDRLLVLVPDGADSLLNELEKRVRGDHDYGYKDDLGNATGPKGSTPSLAKMDISSSKKSVDDQHSAFETESEDDGLGTLRSFVENEWQEMDGHDWVELPFELQSVDSVLHSVCNMLADEVEFLQIKATDIIAALLSPGANLGDQAQELLRSMKNEIQEMRSRVKGLSRALDLVLDDYEDLSLMNLSRLLSHPERYMQPVPQQILEEESDEPELILETYLQQANTLGNALTLLDVQIASTESFAERKSDAVRNRLLYINMVISVLSLCVTGASLVGSFFGMNVINPREDEPNAFQIIIFSTIGGTFVLAVFLTALIQRIGALPSIFS